MTFALVGWRLWSTRRRGDSGDDELFRRTRLERSLICRWQGMQQRLRRWRERASESRQQLNRRRRHIET